MTQDKLSNARKILLVHHGGHKGGYGVCWDLRAPNTVHSHADKTCRDYPANQFGIISQEQFAAIQPQAKAYWNETTLHCGDKESAIKEAERLGLEIVTPQAITKILKSKLSEEIRA